jgi:thiosulfate dehydrogenase
MGRIVLGIILGLILAPVIVWGWLRYGHPPVAVADSRLPFERQIVNIPLHKRIDSEMTLTPPIEANEQTFIAGARIYREQCASCHGVHGQPVSFARHMFPAAPSLWETHHNGKVVGVSDDQPGETYWKVANGIRLSGMPAFKQILSDTEMWQVTLLLANADKPLPPEVLDLLRVDALHADAPSQSHSTVTPSKAK